MNTPESNTAIELEIASPIAISNLAARELAVPADRAATLFAPFAKPFAVAAALIAEEPSATDADSARALRLKIVKARTDIGRTKDMAKADVKIVGSLIDWYHNNGRNECQVVEARLEEIEKAEERAEAERKSSIKRTRLAELLAVGVDGSFYPLGDMPDESYSQLLSSHQIAHEVRLAKLEKAKEDERIAAEKAEADRIARAQAETAERERIRLENERLRKEAAENEAALKVEREAEAKQRAEASARAKAELEKMQREQAAAEAKARAIARIEREKIEAAALAERERASKERAELERKAQDERQQRERLELEAKARLEAEEKLKRDAEEAAARAAAAPDAEKMKAFANVLRSLALPDMSTPLGKRGAVKVDELVEQLAKDVENIAAKIGKAGA